MIIAIEGYDTIFRRFEKREGYPVTESLWIRDYVQMNP
jgi:hypothetical protein